MSVITDIKRKSARITNWVVWALHNPREASFRVTSTFGGANDVPDLIKEVVSTIPVVNIVFKAAEIHKTSILLLAEKNYNEGKLNYHSKIAWERYMKACEKEHQAYENFCHSFIEHRDEISRQS
jgi:hypothetical protein